MDENTAPTTQFMTREEFEQMHQTLQDVTDAYALAPKPKRRDFERKRVAEAFDSAFEALGGATRLAVWAHENYTEFIKLYGRMLPTGTQVDLNANGEIIFRHVLPPSKLDKLENSDGGHPEQSKGSD